MDNSTIFIQIYDIQLSNAYIRYVLLYTSTHIRNIATCCVFMPSIYNIIFNRNNNNIHSNMCFHNSRDTACVISIERTAVNKKKTTALTQLFWNWLNSLEFCFSCFFLWCVCLRYYCVHTYRMCVIKCVVDLNLHMYTGTWKIQKITG